MAHALQVELRGCATWTLPSGKHFRKGVSQVITDDKELAYFSRFQNQHGAMFAVTDLSVQKQPDEGSKIGGKRVTRAKPKGKAGKKPDEDAPL